MKTPARFALAVGLFMLAISSCNKIDQLLPTLPYAQSIEQTPFQSWLDSAMNLGSDSLALTLNPVGLNDVLKPGPGLAMPGQAEVAYAFRAADSGVVVALGVLVPAPGFQHTVTLWDSTSGTVLAQANVLSVDTATWRYVSLALTNQEVVIQPNHGYIVGFNTLAVGNPIDGESPGNLMYFISGYWDTQSSIPAPGEWLPIFPFTEHGITFEGSYLVFYDTPIAPVFPQGAAYPGIVPGSLGVNQTPGVCDIGFIALP